MQFVEKQDRLVCYCLEDGEDLEFKPIFDKLQEESVDQIAIHLPKSFFWSEKGMKKFLSELSLVEMDLQREFADYVSDHEETFRGKVIAIEGYYKKYYKNYKGLYDHDALIILYLIIRERKNMDGIKSLIKVGSDYEL